MAYDMPDLKVPRVGGSALRTLVALVESSVTGCLLIPRLYREVGVTQWRKRTITDPPTPVPYTVRYASRESRAAPATARATTAPEAGEEMLELSRATSGFSFPTIRDYASAYRAGEISPEDVAVRAVRAVRESNAGPRPLRAVVICEQDDVMTQAHASAERYRQGEPLSVLDGVPVMVKDELDQIPYPTHVGTRFLGVHPPQEDAAAVAKLRAAGALLVGKTHMHEIGIGATGLNAHFGPARNPYHQGCFTGGSSSGAGGAVAAGLCPVALGADGGGSIRIPAGLCGVFGLKPTYGRVSERGAAPLCWSVAHIGPLAWSAGDAAVVYSIIAGEDPEDLWSMGQPPARVPTRPVDDLSGVRLGIYEPWFSHASGDVVESCRGLLNAFRQMGAEVVEVEIPELDDIRVAHLVTILSEMATSLEAAYEAHQSELGWETRVNLALARRFTSRDYVRAQQVRTRAIRHFETLLDDVDAIVTPTTACLAPQIPESYLPEGVSDIGLVMELMRFVSPANLTGFPAASIPAGYSGSRLPIGLHAMARPWDERLLLQLGMAAEAVVTRRAPPKRFDILGQA